MKKLLALLLTLGVVLSFNGCKSTSNGKNAKDTKTSSAAVTASPTGTDNADLLKAAKGIKLCKYKNIVLDWNAESNQSLLNNSLQNYTADQKKVTDRAIKNGDTANIDYTGYKDGQPFDNGSAEGYDLSIGSGSFIDGFEEGLVGVRPGETVNLNLTFPENYGNDLSGKAVVFKVKVNYITENNYSDDDLNNAKSDASGSALLNYVIENTNYGTLSESLTKQYKEMLKSYYENFAVSNNYESLSAYLKTAGQTEESFEQLLNETAVRRLKNDLVLTAIAEKEQLMVTDKEYNTALKSYAEAYSCTPSQFESQNGKGNLEITVLSEKVQHFLKSNSDYK